MGKNAGDRFRKQLRRDAFTRFPAERLLVVEKPSAMIAAHEAAKLLSQTAEQIVSWSTEVGRLRYVPLIEFPAWNASAHQRHKIETQIQPDSSNPVANPIQLRRNPNSARHGRF